VVDLAGDFLADLGVPLPFAGDSSRMGDLLGTATDRLFNNGEAAGLGDSVTLGGRAPFLTGVDGGSFFTKYSGLSLGPKETLFLFAEGGSTSESESAFLFLPLLFGVFLADLAEPVINHNKIVLRREHTLSKTTVQLDW